MTSTTYPLPDGSTLTLAGNQSAGPRGIDRVTSRTATYHGNEHGGRLVDADGATVREIVPRASSRAKPSRADTSRWRTLNTFVDVIARHLSPVEIAVWMVLFRDCRDGTATASNRDLCHRTGCSLRAVTAAMKRLRAAGLLEVVKLSRHRGEPSTYTLNSTPAACVPALTGTGATDAPVQDQQPRQPVHHMHRLAK